MIHVELIPLEPLFKFEYRIFRHFLPRLNDTAAAFLN